MSVQAGQVWIVTGAAGSLGSAIATKLANQGASLALLDLNEPAVKELAEQLPGSHAGYSCNVTDEAAVHACVDQIRQDLGSIYGVVNNAGVTHFSAFEETKTSVLKTIMDVNFWGAVYLSQAALADIKANKGAIVALSSVAGFAPLADRTGYAASKHAMNGFFGSLRAELADDGVQVTIVCPSYIAVGDKKATDEGDVARPGSDTGRQVGKPIQPSEVADAIVDALATNKAQVNLGIASHVAYVLSRAAPLQYQKVMLKNARG